MKIELDYLEKLVKLVNDNNLTELSVEEGEKAVIIKKEKEVIATQTGQIRHVEQVKPTAPDVIVHPEPAPVKTDVGAAKVSITSPMVGTFYKAASPDSPPFVEAGKPVSIGQVVCIIEAMKLMNEIESDVAGKIIKICVQDGQPVEYGQVLMIVEPQ